MILILCRYINKVSTFVAYFMQLYKQGKYSTLQYYLRFACRAIGGYAVWCERGCPHSTMRVISRHLKWQKKHHIYYWLDSCDNIISLTNIHFVFVYQWKKLFAFRRFDRKKIKIQWKISTNSRIPYHLCISDIMNFITIYYTTTTLLLLLFLLLPPLLPLTPTTTILLLLL